MKEKIKKAFTNPKFLRFMREVVAVVAGIVLSLTAANLVEDYKRSKNIGETMSLMREELKTNLTRLQALETIVDKNVRASRFFHTNLFQLDSLCIDTVSSYLDDASMVGSFKQESYALDVLKDQSQYEELSNDLLMCISETYDNCDLAHQLAASHFVANKAIIGHLYELQTLHADSLNLQVLKILFEQSSVFKSRCLNPQQMDEVLDMLRYTIHQVNKLIPALDSMIQDNDFTDFTNRYTHDR